MQLPDRFILYRREWNATRSKWDKIPCDHLGANIDPHDPQQWRSYDHAAQYATWDGTPYGVGWVLNGDGWFFLDLDDCRKDGAWTPEADLIFRSFGGALGEVSTSNKGLHIFGKCRPDQLQDRRNKWDGDKEFYTDKRFVALNRHGLSVIGGGTYQDKDWTDQLLNLVPQRAFLGDLPDGRDPAYTGPEDDDTLIAMALRSRSRAAAFGAGVTFRDLWDANAEALGTRYPDPSRPFDHSAADMALMSHLAFWTGKDMLRMDRLFRRSALMRDKYEKRADYRRDTVQSAARATTRVYDTPQKTETANDTEREWFLTAAEMVQYFEGCVYIRDPHRVLVPDGALLKPDQFNAVYGGHEFAIRPDGTKPTTEAFRALTQNGIVKFPQAKRACFRPDLLTGTIVDDEVNVYVPPSVIIKQGDVTPFLDFLHRILPNELDRVILLSWCASLVQNTGVKFQWAPVLQGVEGNGKSLIARCLRYIVGDRYTHEPRASQLTSQFISFDEHMLLIIVEEVHMRGRFETLDELKARITNPWIEVESKGVDKRMVRNTANWILCTNYRDAVIKTRNDRRYATLFTAQQQFSDLRRDGMDGEYFPRLYRWLNSGGYAYVAHYLMNYRIPEEYNPAEGCHRAPITSSTEEAINASIGGIEAEILDAVESERPGFRGGWISSNALERLLKEKGLKVSAPRRGEILRNLGYNNIGRASGVVIREGGTRPNLWAVDGVTGTLEHYLQAQGEGYA